MTVPFLLANQRSQYGFSQGSVLEVTLAARGSVGTEMNDFSKLCASRISVIIHKSKLRTRSAVFSERAKRFAREI